MATKTQTPITLLAEAVRQLCLVSDKPELCISSRCAAARAALEDVEALVGKAERVRYLMDEGEEQMKTAAWTIAWNDATEALRHALAKFKEAKP